MADGAKGCRCSLRVDHFLHTAVTVDKIVLITSRNGNGVAIDSLLAIFQVFSHPPLVWPNGIAGSTCVHTLASVDDEQLVDVAVAIPVVSAPVDILCLQDIHDILNQILRVLIIRISAGIFLGIATDLYIDQVEDDAEVTITLVVEVVVDGALERVFQQVLGIENLVPLFQGSGLAVLEWAIVECYQNSQLVTLAMIEVATR